MPKKQPKSKRPKKYERKLVLDEKIEFDDLFRVAIKQPVKKVTPG